MKQNGTQLKGDQKVEFKKLFELNFKVSFRILTKFGTNFGYFALENATL
jgi:hypothetical protein